MQDIETYRTAIHEAGHALIAHKVRLQVMEISIIPDAHCGGYCLWRMRSRRQSFHRLIAAYAGAEAVWHILGLDEFERAESDFAYARRIGTRRLRKQAQRETERLIRCHRQEIVVLAHLLIKHPIIDRICLRWWLKHPDELHNVLDHTHCQRCGMTLAAAA